MSKSVGISLRALAPRGTPMARWLSIVGPLLDRLLGIAAINTLYERGSLKGLPPFQFAERALQVLGVLAKPSRAAPADRVPSDGPVLVVCNHPYGGIEALILASALRSVRKDVKFWFVYLRG